MIKKQLSIMDSHAHLTSEDFVIDVEGVIDRAKINSIEKIINICTNANELKKGFLLEEKNPNLIKNVAATTPHDAKEEDEDFAFFEKAAQDKKIIAIGETGFDDFIDPDNKNFQKIYCKRYIDLGVRTNLPVIFHVRGDQAFLNLFEIAKTFPPFKGIIHCFTGTLEQAQKALALGWYLSISGIITFKKSQKLQEVVKNIPNNRLLIETDAPWLAPEGFRGKPNEPSFIIKVVETIALIKGQSVDEICNKTFENGYKVFDL